MNISELAHNILNEDLNMPVKYEDLSTKRNEVTRGNVTIYFGCLNQASQSEHQGGNNFPGEHYWASGIKAGVPWYATVRNQQAA